MSRRYVVFPKLRTEKRADHVLVENLAHGTRIEASPDVLELLAAFREPADLDEVLARFGLGAADVNDIVRNHFIVAVDELPTLLNGFLDASSDPPIGETVSWLDLPGRATQGAWVVFGAPVDVATTGETGARHGPRFVRHGAPAWLHRKASDKSLLQINLRRQVALDGLHVFDVGDVHFEPEDPYSVFGQRIHKLVGEICDAGMRPLMIGGDHSVSWFTLEPLLKRYPKLGVIHFDAHHDLYPVPSGRLGHLNPFEFVCREPSLAYLLQLGLRTDEALGDDEDLVTLPKVSCVTARELQTMRAEDVFASLPRDVPAYLTFDVDCLDPTIAPETGTPVYGGLSFEKALELVDYAARNFQLVGADFVEVTGSELRLNRAATLTAIYIGQCVLGGCPTEALTSWVRRPRK